MKLKFRADSKDIAIFCVFCVVLLYLCAIAVLNLSEFSRYGTFFGLNPFPAFTSEFIAPTLVIFVVVLVAVAMSVSSYFFDREKGFGVSTDAKKEKGYSRWCTDKEMKKDKDIKCVPATAETSEFAGIPIMNNGKQIYVDAGEYHNLIIGSTGAGKTETIIQPMVKVLAKKGESMIITDPKGEIYEKNALELKEKGYNIILLNFRNPQNGNCWNPLSLPYQLYCDKNQDKACELLEDLALNILYDESSKGQDPFWEKTSADYFAGLSLGLFEDAKAEEINLNSINLMTTAGEDKVGNTTYIKEYFSDKDQGSPAYINVASTLMAPNETKSSILSVFKQKIKLFSSRENLSEMLSHSDFDMHEIGRKKTAVFIVIQDEKKTYHSLVTIFLKQCYETLIGVAQENGGKLPFKTNFILDEFANMPPLKDVTTMVTAARSRAMRFTFVIQNFAQLYEVYGKENGETIKGNCGNIIYLISSELSALEEISKLCGEVKSKDKDKTDSRPLVTVSDLQRLPQYTMIVLRIRMMPFKTKVTPNWKMVNENGWGKNYDLATYPVREKGIVQTFNIKQFVDKKKEEKVTNMLNSITGGSSKPVDTGFNPFNNSPVSSAPKSNSGGFDVDEMVRKIDAKIAELEEEERREKAKLEAERKNKIPNQEINEIDKTTDVVQSLINDIPVNSISDVPKVEESIPSSNEIQIPDEKSVPVAPLIINQTDVVSQTATPSFDDLYSDTLKPEEDILPTNNNLLPGDDSSDDDAQGSGKFFGIPDLELKDEEQVVEKEDNDILSSLLSDNRNNEVKEIRTITEEKIDNSSLESINTEKNDFIPTENSISKDNINNKTNAFFDFIVPVEEKEEEKIELPGIEEEIQENIPSGLINDIQPVSKVGKQNLIPIDSLPDDIITAKPIEENVEIPKIETTKYIELPKVEMVESKKTIKPKEEPKLIKNVDKIETKVINNNYITDDQFFDDFFNDEE